MATLERLVAEAGERGIRILLDIVPNHSSDRHAWFADSRSSRDARYRDWYVWADGKDGGPPNNWQSVFGGPTWTFDEATGQWYLHNFLPEQPDLNWWTNEVWDAFDDILRFWFDRGHRRLPHRRRARDRERQGAARRPARPRARPGASSRCTAMNRPETHEVFRRWRRICEEYDPPRLLVGETHVLDPVVMASYYGNGDELQLAFNFACVYAPFEAERLRGVIEQTEAAIPEGGWPVWTLSNHDVVRFPTRWAGGDPRQDPLRAPRRAAAARDAGPLLRRRDRPRAAGDSQGEGARLRRPPRRRTHADAVVGETRPRLHRRRASSPGCRSAPGPDVESQRDDPDSVLSLCRDLLAARREREDLRSGAYASLPSPEGVWAWKRGDGHAVAINLGEAEATVDLSGDDPRRDATASATASRSPASDPRPVRGRAARALGGRPRVDPAPEELDLLGRPGAGRRASSRPRPGRRCPRRSP